MNIAIIVAGGCGQRMGQDIPKQFLFVEDKPIIIYTLEKFEKSPLIDAIYVACLAGWDTVLRAYAKQFNITKLCDIVQGGENRFLSIFRVLQHLEGKVADDDIILTFDANRPMISEEMIYDTVVKCKATGAAVAARFCNESMFRGNRENGVLYATDDRNSLVIGTGPEATCYQKALKLFSEKKTEIESPTLCELLLSAGENVAISQSSPKCIKITTVEDIEIFKALLKAKNESWIK